VIRGFNLAASAHLLVKLQRCIPPPAARSRGPRPDGAAPLRAAGQDCRCPHTTGQRARPSPLRRAQEGYLADVEAVAAGDARVWESTYAALYAMASPISTLFAPGIALKVLGLRARRALAVLRGAPAAGGAQERLQQTQ